jgi:ligand-binding SRPBCC domain-containing protein
MPNGGSDCCGTCWFNAKNKGEAGYAHSRDPEPDYCTIRNLVISDAFWTYCANHPHRRPVQDRIPIGPVFVDSKGKGRSVWVASPDTEEIRQHLLQLLAAMIEEPRDEYPIGGYADEIVAFQVGEFSELRALSDLKRIAAFSPKASTGTILDRSRASLVAVAKAALVKIATAYPTSYDPAGPFESRTMPHHLEFEQWVPFPIERVFAFFSNPENLPRIMPAASATKIVHLTRMPPPSPPPSANTGQAAGARSTFVTSFRIFPFLPLRAQWIARITEFEWNHHFADVQEKGPFKTWHHRHEFKAEKREGVEGTLVRDLIDYDVGFGFAGSIANRFLVCPRLQETFRERQKILPSLLA